MRELTFEVLAISGGNQECAKKEDELSVDIPTALFFFNAGAIMTIATFVALVKVTDIQII